MYFPVTVIAAFAAIVSAAPLRRDSAIDEPGVRSPNGTPVTDVQVQPTGAAKNYAESSSMMMMMESSSSMMMKESSSSMMMESSKTMMMESSSTMMSEPPMMTSSSSTMMSEPPMTTSSASYWMPKYGSGMNNWNPGYDGCVQQCMKTYGAPPAMYTPSPMPSQDNKGSGMTHHVVVAPAQGVLRFVPFALNASVGDTVQFHWNGQVHTVTKSSVLEPCNKSDSDPTFFTSGPQQKGFDYSLKINDTKPLWYFCNTPGHCAKGMFGVINPPNAAGASTSLAGMAPAMIKNSTTVANQMAYTMNKTAGSSASSWGDNLDMKDVPASMQSMFAENVMMTRLVYAANPGLIDNKNGMATTDGTPLNIPGDISQLAAASSNAAPSNAADNSSSTASASASAAPNSASGSAAPSATPKNGAMSRAAGSSVGLAAVAIVASIFLL